MRGLYAQSEQEGRPGTCYRAVVDSTGEMTFPLRGVQDGQKACESAGYRSCGWAGMLQSVLLDQAAGVARRLASHRVLPGLAMGSCATIRTPGGSQRVLMESIEALLRQGVRRLESQRCRFRYRPFREMPSALATASTLPWCTRRHL